MPAMPHHLIRFQSHRHHSDPIAPSISPPNELIQLGSGRTPGGYAFESAASMIEGLGRTAGPAATDGRPEPSARVPEQDTRVLSSRLRILDRLLADVRPDVDDQEMSVLRTQAARVSSHLIAAYRHSEPRMTSRRAP